MESLGDVHERCYVAHRTNIDLAAGKESDGAVQIDSEAALDAAEDHAFYACALGKFSFQLVPCGFAASAVARQHGFATGVLHAVALAFAFVTAFQIALLSQGAEFAWIGKASCW